MARTNLEQKGTDQGLYLRFHNSELKGELDNMFTEEDESWTVVK